MTRRATVLVFSFLVLVVLGASGCAGLPLLGAADSEEADANVVDTAPPMDQSRLEQIFADQVEAIAGPTGALQAMIDGIPVYCISDAANDRMRIISPISRIADLNPRVYEILLRANFHSALDARYSISDDVIFSAFLHPISSLSPELIASAVAQVVNLKKTFGTTFSSGELIFPGPESGDSAPEKDEGESRPL